MVKREKPTLRVSLQIYKTDEAAIRKNCEFWRRTDIRQEISYITGVKLESSSYEDLGT